MEKRLPVVAILLLVALGSQGAVDDSYFIRRSEMLKRTKVNFYPQAEGSKTDKGHYENTAPIPHNYKFVINKPDICRQHQKVFLLVLIMGYYPNFRWREINREQLKHRGRLLNQRGLVVKYGFLFGAFSDPSVMNLIKQESNNHHDIIQENFLESYINASLKVSMSYKWAVKYCPNAEYVIVAEDELSFDVDKIVSFLLKDHSKKPYDDHFAICYPVENDRPMHKTEPRYTGLDPKALYKGNYYPPYCRGFGYAAHIEVINKLYRASFVTPSFVPTEAWIGIMAEKLRLKIPNHKQLFIEENLEAYHANPKYPDLPGAIAVPNSRGYRGYEIESLKAIIKSMRKHWKKNLLSQNNSILAKKEDKIDKSKDSRDKMGSWGENKLDSPRWGGKGDEIGKVNGKAIEMVTRAYKGPQMGKKKGKGVKMDEEMYKGLETVKGEDKRVKEDKPWMKLPIKKGKQKSKDGISNSWSGKSFRTNKQKDNGVRQGFKVGKQIKIKKKMDKEGIMDTRRGEKVKSDKLNDNGIKLNEEDKKVDKPGDRQIKIDKQKDKETKIDKWKAKGVTVKGVRLNKEEGKGEDRWGHLDKGKVEIDKPKVKQVKIDKWKYKRIKTDKQKIKPPRRKYSWIKTDKWKGRQDKSLYISHVHDRRKDQSSFKSTYVYLFVALTAVIVLVFRKQILNIFAKLYHLAPCFKNK